VGRINTLSQQFLPDKLPGRIAADTTDQRHGLCATPFAVNRKIERNPPNKAPV
jgi:hypothetical protein